MALAVAVAVLAASKHFNMQLAARTVRPTRRVFLFRVFVLQTGQMMTMMTTCWSNPASSQSGSQRSSATHSQAATVQAAQGHLQPQPVA
jgi:hypothetical protein